jgi:hypothetical protein
MKYTKSIAIVLLVLVTGAAAFYAGVIYVTGKVKQGVIDNYPTFKNIVQSADIEADTLITLDVSEESDKVLYDLLNTEHAEGPLTVTIPYYSRYGMDLSVRHYRIHINEQGELEVWLPVIVPKYCEVKFDRVLVNGKPANIYGSAKAIETRAAVYNFLLPELAKHRQHKKDAALSITKALMYYVIPMQHKLKLYIDKQEQQLPLLPGVNQSIDDAVRSTYNTK